MRQSATSCLRLVQAAHPRLGAIPTDRAQRADARGVTYALRRLGAEVAFKLDYMHKEAPPRGVRWVLSALDKAGLLGSHKWLPYRLWFQHELSSFVRGILADSATGRLGFWDPGALATIVDDHVNGKRNGVREINAVLTLLAVDRLLLRRWSAAS